MVTPFVVVCWALQRGSRHLSPGIYRLPTIDRVSLGADGYTLLNNIQPIGTEQSLTINSQCLTQRWKKEKKKKIIEECNPLFPSSAHLFDPNCSAGWAAAHAAERIRRCI